METKQPYIIGIGPGNQGYLYPLAEEAIKNADVLIGGKRNLSEFNHFNKKTLAIDKSLKDIATYIEKNWQREAIAVLASGDTGLFSIRAYLQKQMPKIPFKVLPGISSLQYLMAQENLSWNEVKIITLHGSDAVNVCNTVAINPATAIFTGGKNTPRSVAEKLLGLKGLNLEITVGENLSYPEERIVRGKPEEIAELDFDDLNLMIVKNKATDKVLWPYCTPGLPDELFIRDEVPMTKSEIRSLIMSKLRLKADSNILEIGSGTGSCTIEMALLARDGHVTTIEKNRKAWELCKKNTEHFGLDNIELINGSAPMDIPSEKSFDRVFIGGSAGNMAEIINTLSGENTRVVVSAITLESVAEALKAMDDQGFENIEVIQAAVSRSKKAGSKHLMLALNPITIISGDKI
ncbi:MAG: precorrin-6y C5,15-methyltransferase (decarboxylating) subunit CbiE [Bacillota bacterium]|nr:precorrin-6y C5,15-methyltransferase (decarboxylating) subunit CbiE [Bacillota bacterium]